jgi:hypothetical protein
MMAAQLAQHAEGIREISDALVLRSNAQAMALAERDRALAAVRSVSGNLNLLLTVLEHLTGPAGTFDASINPGPERDALLKIYRELR